MTTRLNSTVPVAVHKALYQRLLTAPNVFEVEVFRKEALRTDTQANDLPTVGGMGQLSIDDEDDYDYALIGSGLMQFVGQYQEQPISNSGESLAGNEAIPQMAVILSELPVGQVGHFEVERNDFIALKYGLDNVIPFTVSDVLSPIGITGFNRRYVIQRADDLDYVNTVLTNAIT